MLSELRAENVCGSVRGVPRCSCEGRCLGYDTQEECPPLIVFAIQAVELALGHVTPAMQATTVKAGAR